MLQTTKSMSEEKEKISAKGLSGAKWVVIANTAGTGCTYLATVLLGRINPETLGYFALVQMLISTILTFVLFGGETVLSNYLPKIDSDTMKNAFVSSYGALIMSFMLLFSLVLYFYPQLLFFLLRKEVDPGFLKNFIVISLAVLVFSILMGAGIGEMKFRSSAVANFIVRFVPFLGIGFIFCVRPVWFEGNEYGTILKLFMLAYLLATGFLAFSLYRHKLRVRQKLYFPKGFWAFTLSSHLATIFTFVYNQFDRFCILSLDGFRDLGYYQAVITLLSLTDYLPILLLSITLPIFSKMSGDANAYKQTFSVTYFTGMTLMTGMVIVMIGFSDNILGIYGEGYTKYAWILIMFCLVNVFRGHALATLSVLLASEMNMWRTVTSIIQITIQIAGTVLFLRSYGILAIVISKVVAVIIISSVNHGYVLFKIRKSRQIPRCFTSAVAVSVVLAGVKLMLPQSGIAISGIITMITGLIYLKLNGITFKEIIRLLRALKRNEPGTLRESVFSRGAV